jgi:hypothetical protein
MTSLFLSIESLVSDILAGDGNIEKLFYGVGCHFLCFRIPRKRETIPGAEFPKQFLDELAEPVLDKLAATFTKTL